MIPVIETKDGFEPIGGNPTLTSLDGEIRAPLAVILHESWTAKERAEFGVFIVEPLQIPAGKEAIGRPRYGRDRSGKVIQVRDMEDERRPTPSTATEKVTAMLGHFGLTVEEMRAVLSDKAVPQ